MYHILLFPSVLISKAAKEVREKDNLFSIYKKFPRNGRKVKEGSKKSGE